MAREIFPTLMNKEDALRKRMRGEFLREVGALVMIFPALDFWINLGRGHLLEPDSLVEVGVVFAVSFVVGSWLLKRGISLHLDAYLIDEKD